VTFFRLGLIGSGWISGTYMAALRQVPEGDAVAVWSRSRENAERFAQKHHLPIASDRLDDVLPHVDVVCVNSPNACHAEHAVAAARAGKHVIVEKPLAVSLEEGHAIVDACREAGVGLGYAEELTFVPKFVRAREIIESGGLGDVLYITQREAHGGPYSAWFFTREEAGGGVLMDMACHSIECVRWLLGKPEVRSVSAQLETYDAARTSLDDHAFVHLRFANGVRAHCEASWVLQGGMQSRLEIWGSRGYLDVDLLHGTGLRLYSPKGDAALEAPPGWSMTMTDWALENGYPQELTHFLKCFAEDREPEESGTDGLKVLEVLYAAYASAREERVIELPFQPAGVERAVDLWLPPTSS
jgi:predicted dehydrogenase